MLLRKILTLRKQLGSFWGSLRIDYAWALLTKNEKGTHPKMAPAHLEDFKKAAPGIGNTWVEHKVPGTVADFGSAKCSQMTQRSLFFMTRDTLGGSQHGKPHSCGGPELQFIYRSLPPSGGHRWYYTLCCSQAWLLRYLAYMLQIWPTSFTYTSHSVFLDIPKFDIAIQDCIPLFFFSAKVSFKNESTVRALK